MSLKFDPNLPFIRPRTFNPPRHPHYPQLYRPNTVRDQSNFRPPVFNYPYRPSFTRNTNASEDSNYAFSFHAQAKINNLCLDHLVDSGSQSNLINVSATRGLYIKPSSKILKAANETPIKMLGEVNINVQFPNQLVSKTRFLVCDEVGEVVVGAAFMIDKAQFHSSVVTDEP